MLSTLSDCVYTLRILHFLRTNWHTHWRACERSLFCFFCASRDRPRRVLFVPFNYCYFLISQRVFHRNLATSVTLGTGFNLHISFCIFVNCITYV